ncbi:hypothetical protein [Roseibium sp. RKSG952]|uniref:capsular polysaccharide export protein, LipB/KpsS family n=1 Tax=Roseibium sp. RKSG952 TaxID=2529384 RepID=UPI0012BD61A3|nr:hypothetical protein [Roseibium sp. RKSG952]MTI01176.1 hypothetical protein [Roseibium sp. RKSG952]
MKFEQLKNVDLDRMNVLALGDRLSSAYQSIVEVTNLFGKLTYTSEHGFRDVQDFIDYLRGQTFNIVMMPNPYGNGRRLAIYRALKGMTFPVVVWDRGGLPDSWFFDTGFNADSESYRLLNWDKKLPIGADDEIESYIQHLKEEAFPLERQGPRVGGRALRKKLGLDGKKILFVPFQRPSDTTVKYFSGSVSSFEQFVSLIDDISNLLAIHSPEWSIVAKRHPLEVKNPPAGVIFVEDDVHIHDLLDACDAVCLINSGVGLLAAAFNKPVLYFGKTYYGHPKLNRKVETADDVVVYLQDDLFIVDKCTRNRLFFHLKNRIYSFGKSKMEIVKQKDGSLRNIVREIDFYDVKLPACVSKLKKKFSLLPR